MQSKTATYYINLGACNLPLQLQTGSGSIQYTYNAEGLRTEKRIGNTVTHYVRGKDGEVLASYVNNAIQSQPIYAGGEMIGNYDRSQRRYYIKDHLGSIRTTVNESGAVVGYDDYYPYGLIMPGRSSNTGNPNDDYKFTGYEVEDDLGLNLYNASARLYDPVIGRFMQTDPLAAEYPGWSPYNYVMGNPLSLTDPTGRAPWDWVEGENGKIYWDEDAISQETAKEGETWLGKNVLVATHNRDANLVEPINTARFDLYLESNKEGISATIMGNTVPADISKYGTLAEGLYTARAQGRAKYLARGQEDLALIINEGKSVPTAPGSPKSSMTEIFFHAGNYARKSLYYYIDRSKGLVGAISEGCQTSLCGLNSRSLHNDFMKVVGTDFKGFYYLRSQSKLEVPKFE